MLTKDDYVYINIWTVTIHDDLRGELLGNSYDLTIGGGTHSFTMYMV